MKKLVIYHGVPRGMRRHEATGRLVALPDEERFWLAVERTEECWNWRGALTDRGYGLFRGFGEKRAHRAAFVLYKGRPIRAGLLVLHTCDNRRCVRESHLYEGTSADNSRDMMVRERHRPSKGDANGARTRPERLARGAHNGAYTRPETRPRGERHGRAKLTDNDVLVIRKAYGLGQITQRSLARMYGIHQSTVHAIVRQQNWNGESQ